MSHYVVTISRQFAAMGRTIGLKMASNLGIELLDRDIVKEAAKRLGLQKGEVSHYDENPGRQSFFLRKTYLFDFSVYSIHNNVFEVQKNIIQDYADKESCIIVGRCADFILQDRTDCLKVFVHANMKFRADRIVRVYGEREKSPEARLKEKDKRRAAYYRFYTDMKWGDAANYHVALDSGVIGIEKCAKVIESLA